MSYINTDDMQYARDLGDRCFMLIEAIEIADDESDKPFAVYSGYIDLGDYSKEEIDSILLSYYPSYEEFLESNRLDKEQDKAVIDQLLAEMVFETDFYDNTYHGNFTEDEAKTFMEDWMKEHDDKEAEEIER